MKFLTWPNKQKFYKGALVYLNIVRIYCMRWCVLCVMCVIHGGVCCQISLPAGALDCWVFLTCLEVLDMCAKSANNVGVDGSPRLDTYSNHVATLYDCARTKVWRHSVLLTVLCHLASAVVDVVHDLLSAFTVSSFGKAPLCGFDRHAVTLTSPEAI